MNRIYYNLNKTKIIKQLLKIMKIKIINNHNNHKIKIKKIKLINKIKNRFKIYKQIKKNKINKSSNIKIFKTNLMIKKMNRKIAKLKFLKLLIAQKIIIKIMNMIRQNKKILKILI